MPISQSAMPHPRMVDNGCTMASKQQPTVLGLESAFISSEHWGQVDDGSHCKWIEHIVHVEFLIFLRRVDMRRQNARELQCMPRCNMLRNASYSFCREGQRLLASASVFFLRPQRLKLVDG